MDDLEKQIIKEFTFSFNREMSGKFSKLVPYKDRFQNKVNRVESRIRDVTQMLSATLVFMVIALFASVPFWKMVRQVPYGFPVAACLYLAFLIAIVVHFSKGPPEFFWVRRIVRKFELDRFSGQ